MRLVALSLMLLAAVLPIDAPAKSSDRQQPMDIEADRTEAGLGDDSEATLSGNVKISQGSLQVDAARATIHRRGGEISQVVLSGSPATLRQVADNGEPMTARASQIVYTLSSDVVLLTGSVVIEQPRGTLRGETIKYDLKTGRMDGGGDGNRVKMRIMPKNAGTGAN